MMMSEAISKVLLIEDDPLDAELFRIHAAHFKGQFYIDHVTSLAAAKAVAKTPFDVIVTDLSLPDSTGIATVKSVLEMFPLTPVVVMTGESDSQWGQEAVRLGCQDYLAKGPNDPERLSRTLVYAMERKAAQVALSEITDLMILGQRLAGMGSFEYDLKAQRWTLSETWREISGAEVSPTTTDEVLRWVHPDDRNRMVAAFQAALRGSDSLMEYRVIHQASGETRWLRVRGALLRDAVGRPARFRGVMQDITQEKRREMALQDSLRRLNQAEEIARIGSWSLDPAVGVPTWSDEVYRIYERDPALGPIPVADYPDLYAADQLAVWQAAIGGAIQRGEPYDITLRLDLSGKRIKWVHAIGRPQPEPGPAGHMVHGTIQDVTEQKHNEDLREDIQRILRHDLRGPVASTLAGITLLRLGDTLSDDQLKTLDMMERANLSQLSMLEASMVLQRIEAGSFELEAEPVDIAALVLELSQELASLADHRGARLSVHYDTPVVALGEAFLCRMLLSNILRNALEALPERGQAVDVDLHVTDAEVVVTCENPGEVPSKIRDCFFDKFVTSGKTGGTGLGTYSALMMARAQGGTVQLDCSRPGWTTLTVRLPRPDETGGG